MVIFVGTVRVFSSRKSRRVDNVRSYGDNLCIWYNFTQDRAEIEPDDVTLCVHGSINYGKFVFDHAVHWNGHVSAAVYINNNSFEAVAAYSRLAQCMPKRRFVQTHLVWRAPTCDKSFVLNGLQRIQVFDAMDAIDGCNIANFTTVFQSERLADDPYPANVLRNLARKTAPTDVHLIADIENHFSHDASQVAKAFAPMVRDKKVAVAVRRFEFDERLRTPRTVRRLHEMMKNKTAMQFHEIFYGNGHAVPFLDEWIEYSKHPTNSPQLLKVTYPDTHWEPQLILSRYAPYHFEAIPFGYKDQTVLPYELCRAGYTFTAGSHIFSSHRGIRQKGAYKGMDRVDGTPEHAEEAFQKFKWYLRQTYPNVPDTCGPSKWA
uniref:Beta-1,4-glucuronyltransferase 1 n=1 Tax=Panagrellus redivivus TaxID=6233 RepID=A0A7E4VHH1_PANRE